jgi:hypothetical protein
MHAAVVELDPLPDPVGPAAQDHDLLFTGRIRFALRAGCAGIQHSGFNIQILSFKL